MTNDGTNKTRPVTLFLVGGGALLVLAVILTVLRQKGMMTTGAMRYLIWLIVGVSYGGALGLFGQGFENRKKNREKLSQQDTEGDTANRQP